MQQTTVFFRDDDVGEMTDALRRVLDVLLQARIPCHYEVVPAYLDERSAEQLQRLQKDDPDLVFLDQHGLRHAQVIDGNSRASEFAGSRPYEEQRTDIARGREILEQMLGDSFAGEVFTPPCHKYDGATLRAVGDLGFRILSAGVRADLTAGLYYATGRALGRVTMLGRTVSYHHRRMPDPRLTEISVAIDVHEDVDSAGRRIEKTVDGLWGEFQALRGRLREVGIMLHHQACDTAAKAAVLREFVGRLQADPGVRFSRIGELAKAVR